MMELIIPGHLVRIQGPEVHQYKLLTLVCQKGDFLKPEIKLEWMNLYSPVESHAQNPVNAISYSLEQDIQSGWGISIFENFKSGL